MKFLTKILFLSLGILALASCSSNDDDKDSPDEQQTYRRSVIIYLAAQNSLGYAEPGWASASYLDSLDIMKGVSKLSRCSIFVSCFGPPLHDMVTSSAIAAMMIFLIFIFVVIY